jgi:NADH dehydrogenase/NADH:ubiquinone oxidoreductase subunit G
LNILNNAFSFKEVGLFSVHEQNLLLPNYSINFLCNYDEQPSVGGSLNVYQGHHGDLNAGRSDLILSSTSFMEKEAMYCNISGLVQKTRKILFGAGNLRDD